MQTRASSRRVTRQSTRPNTVSVAGSKRIAFSEIEDPKPKRRRTLSNVASSVSHGGAVTPSASTSLIAKPSNEVLLWKEHCGELESLRKELKQRNADIERLETTAQSRDKEAEVSERKQALEFLEEHFSCSLCLEVMAHPLTIPHPNCGHSFCAICILKHFFSQYHRGCGNWHENVACPMCRSILNYTSECSPPETMRSLLSFPFAKNRVANSTIESLVARLARNKPTPARKRKGKVSGKDETDSDSGLEAWRTGGSARKDWADRNKSGHTEIEYLSRNWAVLTSTDFNALKDRLLS